MFAERLVEIRGRIASAATAVGRDPESVTLLAVSKTVSADIVHEAILAGQTHFGENYVQEALAKEEMLRLLSPTAHELHLIGPLQRNKAKNAVGFFSLIHTLDRQSLADALSNVAVANGITQNVLLQVNISAEGSKSGVAPEEATALAQYVSGLLGISLQGLMCIGSMLSDENEERSRREFQALFRLRESLQQKLSLPLPHLSMGMSNDFEIAVQEGATIVRVGSALFGKRNAQYKDL